MLRRIIPVIIVAVIVLIVLYMNGLIGFNHPSKSLVRGVDVSHYQGHIDWHQLEAQDIHFAYIKATEGSSWIDPCYEQNRAGIWETGIHAGAYHFFSFDSSGEAQARHFCSIAKLKEDALPPVVDVERYGSYKFPKKLNSDEICASLATWLQTVEKECGRKPVIYTTKELYRAFIAERFPEHDIWIRSVYTKPSNDIDWTFWQYSDRVQLEGTDGEERFIDMNVFSEDESGLDDYLNQNCT